MKATTKAKIVTWSGYGIGIIAPLTATATQFDIWTTTDSQKSISGAFIIVAILCLIPVAVRIMKLQKQKQQINPSNSLFIVWGAVFLTAVLFRSIIDNVIIISAVGLGGNFVQKAMTAIGTNILKKESVKNGDKTAEILEKLSEKIEV